MSFWKKGCKWNADPNAHAGPIYVGKNAEIMEGSMLRGPVVIGAETISNT